MKSELQEVVAIDLLIGNVLGRRILLFAHFVVYINICCTVATE